MLLNSKLQISLSTRSTLTNPKLMKSPDAFKTIGEVSNLVDVPIYVLRFWEKKIDLIISDMAANTTGNKSLDCIRTNQLCTDVINYSSEILKPEGVLVSKVFMGEDFIETKNLAKSKFKKVQFFKPESSRNESKETYLHCSILKTL